MFRSYQDLSQTDLETLGPAVAILPMGATENHGTHLPLGTDTILAEAIVDRCGRRLGASQNQIFLRLPALWLGASGEHEGRAGTLSERPENVISNIVAIASGLAKNGIDRLVVLNAHGGNTAPGQIAALRVRTEFGMLCAVAHWLDFGLPEDLDPPTSPQMDVHGGWMETSMMMAVAPELVGSAPSSPLPKSPAPLLFPEGPIAWGWTADDLGVDGTLGRADLADAEIGNRLLDHAAAGLKRLMLQIADAPWPIVPGSGA